MFSVVGRSVDGTDNLIMLRLVAGFEVVRREGIKGE